MRAPCPRRWVTTALLGLLLIQGAGPLWADAWTEFEKAIGQLTEREMSGGIGLVHDPLLQAWVESVGRRIMAQSTRPTIRYRFLILDTAEENAYSLPGGTILVTRGLLEQVASEEELAGVFAHELAHSCDRDFAELVREQVFYLGLQAWLRHADHDNWVLPAQLLQIIDTLRRSRGRESLADRVGIELARQAGDDPDGLLSFLRTISDDQGWLDRALSTHPSGQGRLREATRHLEEINAKDYAGLMALAEQLAGRWELRRAARQYRWAARNFPQQSLPCLRLGQIEERRGLTAAAEAAYRQALAREPGLEMAQIAVARLAQAPESDLATLTVAGEPRRQLQAAVDSLPRQDAALRVADQRLFEQLQTFYDDKQIAAALEAGQVIAPETNEAPYLAAVTQAFLLLARADKAYMALSGMRAHCWETQRLLERLGPELLGDIKVPATVTTKGPLWGQCVTDYNAQVATGLPQCLSGVELGRAACGSLLQGTRLVAVAFLALVSSGPGQPLGRLSYTRFLLLQGDIELARHQIERAEQAIAEAQAPVLKCHLASRELQLSMAGVRATSSQGLIYAHLLAPRLQCAPADVWEWQQGGRLGEGVRRQLEARCPGAGLQALSVHDTLARVCALDVRNESLPDDLTP
jgi:Zn-dependent protease with chaperone function